MVDTQEGEFICRDHMSGNGADALVKDRATAQAPGRKDFKLVVH
jgi:hypothetical protein